MAEGLIANAAALFTAMLLLWRVAARIGDVSFIDAVWGGGMAALAVLAWANMAAPGARATMIMAMTLTWGGRLALHLFARWRRHGEDPRYARILGPARKAGRYDIAALSRVFGPQAVLLYVTCLPAQLGILASPAPAPPGPLAVIGAALWVIGFGFETVGDWQLERFRAAPANKGRVLDSGLWRYTRHPNYFGDACAWWGIWLACADAGWGVGVASLPGPLFLTFTLTRWSGKPLLEKGMSDRRPGYADYVRKTSGFIPWPPRKSP